MGLGGRGRWNIAHISKTSGIIRRRHKDGIRPPIMLNIRLAIADPQVSPGRVLIWLRAVIRLAFLAGEFPGMPDGIALL